MLASSELDYIHALCNQLQAQQQTPSVALLKSRSRKNLPLKAYIDGLARWRADPQPQPKNASTTTQDRAGDDQDLLTRVQRLEAQVAELTAQLATLTDKPC